MLIFTAKPVKTQAFLILKSKNTEIMAIFTVRTVKTNPNYPQTCPPIFLEDFADRSTD
jgi:hypothetical protein